MKLMKTQYLIAYGVRSYSINIITNSNRFSLDFNVDENRLEFGLGHWQSMFKVKEYVIS